MRQIKTEISIAANPKTVWEVLMDFENYPNWNPFITSIQGEKAVGKKLRITVHPPDGKEMTFKPEVLIFEPGKKLKWMGKGPVKGLFAGVHVFELEAQHDGSTRFIHSEQFTGLLVGIMRKTLDKTEYGFKQMNSALKKECENTK